MWAYLLDTLKYKGRFVRCMVLDKKTIATTYNDLPHCYNANHSTPLNCNSAVALCIKERLVNILSEKNPYILCRVVPYKCRYNYDKNQFEARSYLLLIISYTLDISIEQTKKQKQRQTKQYEKQKWSTR